VEVQLGVLLALVSAFIWGSTTIIARVFLRDRGGMLLNILRLLISAPFYLIILIFYGFPPLTPFIFLIIILSSLAGFVIGDYFFFSAMKLMGVSRSVLIATMYPLWVMALGYFLLNRSITPQMIFGALLIIAAIIIISLKKEELGFHYLGVLYAFIAQILWALAVISIDWLLQGLPVLQVTGIRITTGAGLILIALPWSIGEIRKLRPKEWLFAFIIAFFGTVVAQYTFTMAINLSGSGIAAPVAETSPLIATIFAKVFLHEKVTSKLFLAILLTVVGVIILMV
jgi:DME family drug/metabolite transporter